MFKINPNHSLKFRYFSSIISFFIYVTPLVSFCQELNSKHISEYNDLKIGKINFITKDHNDFMWFSDQIRGSIIRYDGNQMLEFKNEIGDPNSLGGNYPEYLLADTLGNIWIGFYGQGLDRFDTENQKFTHFRHNPDDPDSLGNDFVTSILIDHLGKIWIGTNDGLDCLDIETGKFKHFRFDSEDLNSLSHNVVRVIYEDSSGVIWVGTGLPWNNNDNGGLNRFNRDAQNFTRFKNDPNNLNSLANNKVRSILEDSYGNFWIGTMKEGLHSMNRETEEIKRFPYDPDNLENPSRPPLRGKHDHITFIVEDSQKNLWIGTLGNGIIRYDPITKYKNHYGKGKDESIMNQDNSGWMAYASKDGFIWLTNEENNLYKIDLYNNKIPFIENKEVWLSYFEESKSIIWIGTENGLIRKNLMEDSYLRFVSDSMDINSLSNNYVRKILKDESGNLWIGTGSGLNLYDSQTKSFKKYLNNPNDENSLSENYVSALCEEDSLNLWVGTYSNGLNLLNHGTGIITRYKNDLKDSLSLSNNAVRAILKDKDDNLWVGVGFNGGLNKKKKNSSKFSHYLSGFDITCLYQDSDSNIWVGTMNGLFKYDLEKDKFYNINDKNKGIFLNTVIISILEDDSGSLWISTQSGIFSFNKKVKRLIHYGEEKGVVFEDKELMMSGFGYKSSDGKLIFNKASGYFSFSPDSLNIRIRNSKLFFHSFWINNEKVNSKFGGESKTENVEPKKLRLDYDQNIFSFGFSSIDYNDFDDKPIYYKLENYDIDWQRSPPNLRVNYFKVPSGSYKFKIKSLDRLNGEWIEKSINIIILNPWWKTIWAYFLYFILLLVLISITHKYQKSRVVKIEREKAQRMELIQAKKIKKAYKKLKTAQNQLIQSEKMASIGELSTGIAHEIRNPLNFVNNFSELNIELLQELMEELKDENYKEVNLIAENIISNQKKVRHHGSRADIIIKEMLSYSRFGSGQMEIANISKLIQDYLRVAYNNYSSKNKDFEFSLNLDLEDDIDQIEVIPQDIGRVLINIFTNAFYAMDQKRNKNLDNYQPTISIKTFIKKNYLNIEVIDNGIGMPEEVLNKIFQPFFTSKPTGEGTGLGLYVSYEILASQGGKLNVESTEGYGSKFTIQLQYDNV